MPAAGRPARVARILETFVWWSRVMARARPAPFGDLALTPSQKDALFALAHSPGPVTHGSLAAALGLTAGAVTQLLDPLRRSGLVDQRPNPADARSRILSLSQDAAAHIHDLESSMIDHLAPRFDDLTDGELADLEALLSRTAGR